MREETREDRPAWVLLSASRWGASRARASRVMALRMQPVSAAAPPDLDELLAAKLDSYLHATPSSSTSDITTEYDSADEVVIHSDDENVIIRASDADEDGSDNSGNDFDPEVVIHSDENSDEEIDDEVIVHSDGDDSDNNNDNDVIIRAEEASEDDDEGSVVEYDDVVIRTDDDYAPKGPSLLEQMAAQSLEAEGELDARSPRLSQATSPRATSKVTLPFVNADGAVSEKLWIKILSYLPIAELCKMCSISKDIKSVSESDALWLPIYKARWGVSEKPSAKLWKEVFMFRAQYALANEQRTRRNNYALVNGRVIDVVRVFSRKERADLATMVTGFDIFTDNLVEGKLGIAVVPLVVSVDALPVLRCEGSKVHAMGLKGEEQQFERPREYTDALDERRRAGVPVYVVVQSGMGRHRVIGVEVDS